MVTLSLDKDVLQVKIVVARSQVFEVASEGIRNLFCFFVTVTRDADLDNWVKHTPSINVIFPLLLEFISIVTHLELRKYFLFREVLQGLHKNSEVALKLKIILLFLKLPRLRSFLNILVTWDDVLLATILDLAR